VNLLTTEELASLVDGLAGLPYGGRRTEVDAAPAQTVLTRTDRAQSVR